jgi:hypothetical protein
VTEMSNDETVLGMVRENIAKMNSLEGFDVVIVCCSSDLQANYWQKRLESGRGSVISEGCIVLSVQEDWPGGAGNGTFCHIDDQTNSYHDD